jgi:hypothetical protein
MSLVFVDWLNENEDRAYPINEVATRVATSGVILPNNILVDANIALPRSAGRFVYVSSIGISTGLVSLTLVASSTSLCEAGSSLGTPTFTPIGAISLRRPIVRFKNYPILAMYPGVAGWVAFGGGALDLPNGTYLFAGPAEAQLVDRAVRSYDDTPVFSLGKVGAALALTGIVRIAGVSGITRTFKAQRVIEGVTRDVGVIGLDTTINGVTTLQTFAGNCGHRPQVNTCNSTPIVAINGVPPDCDGDIAIRFEGEQSVGDTGDGMVIDFPISLPQICPKTFKQVMTNKDVCGGSSSSSSSSSSDSSSSSSSSVPPPTPEYCNDLLSGLGELVIKAGLWTTPADGIYSDPGHGGDQYVIDPLRTLKLSTVGDTYIIKATVSPTQPNGEGHIIAAWSGGSDFYFIGVSILPNAADGFPNGYFFIGKRSGIQQSPSLPPANLRYNLLARYDPGVPLAADDYRIIAGFARGPGNVAITFRINWGAAHQTHILNVAPNLIRDGFAGLGSVGSRTRFTDLGINCGGSSSSIV